MLCGGHLPQSIDKVERAGLHFSKREMDPNQPWRGHPYHDSILERDASQR